MSRGGLFSDGCESGVGGGAVGRPVARRVERPRSVPEHGLGGVPLRGRSMLEGAGSPPLGSTSVLGGGRESAGSVARRRRAREDAGARAVVDRQESAALSREQRLIDAGNERDVVLSAPLTEVERGRILDVAGRELEVAAQATEDRIASLGLAADSTGGTIIRLQDAGQRSAANLLKVAETQVRLERLDVPRDPWVGSASRPPTGVSPDVRRVEVRQGTPNPPKREFRKRSAYEQALWEIRQSYRMRTVRLPDGSTEVVPRPSQIRLDEQGNTVYPTTAPQQEGSRFGSREVPDERLTRVQVDEVYAEFKDRMRVAGDYIGQIEEDRIRQFIADNGRAPTDMELQDWYGARPRRAGQQ